MSGTASRYPGPPSIKPQNRKDRKITVGEICEPFPVMSGAPTCSASPFTTMLSKMKMISGPVPPFAKSSSAGGTQAMNIPMHGM